jgi:hypothetical protein
MYPATGANTTKSGGKIPFDHQGGPKGGIEIGFWGKGFPNGVLYPVGVTNVGGATVNWQIDVFLDGQPLTSLIDGTGSPVTKLTGRISKGEQQGGLAAVGQGGPPPPPPSGFSVVSAASANGQAAKPQAARSRVQKVQTPSRAFITPAKPGK